MKLLLVNALLAFACAVPAFAATSFEEILNWNDDQDMPDVTETGAYWYARHTINKRLELKENGNSCAVRKFWHVEREQDKISEIEGPSVTFAILAYVEAPYQSCLDSRDYFCRLVFQKKNELGKTMIPKSVHCELRYTTSPGTS